MKAKKSLIAVAAAATVINGLPLQILADEPDQNLNVDDGNPEEGISTQSQEREEEKDPAIKLEFVDENGKPFNIYDAEDGILKFEKTQDEATELSEGNKANRVVFDLSAVEGNISVDKDLYRDYSISYDEEKKELTVDFNELTTDQILKVKVEKEVKDEVTDESPEGNSNNRADNENMASEETVDEPAPQNDTDNQSDKAVVTINFVYSDSNKPVAGPCVIQVRKNNSGEISGTWQLAKPLGYELDVDSVNLQNIPGKIELSVVDGKLHYTAQNIDGDMNLTIKYNPADVNYTVVYYQQNANDDGYTQVNKETLSGKTGSEIAAGLNKQDRYPGFYGLTYDTTETIAADGTTEVSIYYDRDYYLMRFDLDGGYGTEPVYGRFGASVNVAEPKKAGYTFDGWTDKDGNKVETLPETIPAEDTVYTANWKAAEVNYTVVYWTENANDDNFSLATTTTNTAQAGTVINGNSFKSKPSEIGTHFTFKEATEDTVVAGDGSTVINVYYSRNVYTYRFFNKKTLVHTFSAKYQADISDKWTFRGTDGRDYPNYEGTKIASWKPESTTPNGVVNRICRQSTMEGADIKWNLQSPKTGTNTYIYYVEALPGQKGDTTLNGINYIKKYEFKQDFDYVYAKEEFFEIDGFDRYQVYKDSKQIFKDGLTGSVSAGENHKYKFYYKRNKYNLTFNNKGETTTTSNVPFETPLSNYNYTPLYPATAGDASAVKFDGWYTSPYFNEGTKVDFTSATMPADNVILFANWVPVTHKVTFYKDAEKTEQHHHIAEVNHGSLINEEVAEPENASGPFIGWFNTADNDQEKAFDHKNTPVVQDLELYAKHRSDTLVNYSVSYVYVDENDNKIDIAPSKTGSGLVGRNKTESALTGDALNTGYQEGYFPKVRSTSIVLNANGGNDIVFEYVKAESVPYSVVYYDILAEKELGREEMTTTKAVVTETARVYPGYVVDQTSKSLVLEYSDGTDTDHHNVVIFNYIKDEENANVGERYFKDDETEPFLTKPDQLEKRGTVVKLTPSASLPNYKLDKVVITDATGKELETVSAANWDSYNGRTLDENGLIYNFYYAGYFNVYLQCNNGTPIEMKYLDHKENLDVTALVPKTNIYGGLYTDISFVTPKTDIGNGKQLKPQVGGNYYVKTVDRNYLNPTMYAIYNTNSKVIDRIDVFTATDNDNYQLVTTGHPGHMDTASNLFQQLQINRKDENKVPQPYKTETAETLFSALKVKGGLLSGTKVANGSEMESSQDENGVVTYTYSPYFVTPDGVLVHTRRGRTFTFTNRDFGSAKYVNHNNSGSGDSITEVYSAPQTFSKMRVMATYLMSEPDQEEDVQPDTPAAPEVEETPEVPEETNKVNVTTVVDGNENIISVAKGLLVNQLPVNAVDGKVFAGWYKDSTFTVPADLTDVQEDTTIYGRYIPLSEIKINASKESGNSKSMKCSVTVLTDSDIYQDAKATVEYNGNVDTIELNKKSVKVGSFLDRLFGREKTVIQYSANITLNGVKSTKDMVVTTELTTKDGSIVEGPNKTFSVSKNSIR